MNSKALVEPVRNRFFTPGIFVCIALMSIGAVFGLFRFLFGLGLVTNLDNQFPWGLWIGFDVVTGVALAAGGFTSSALAYVFNRRQFHAVVRPALLTAMLGYTFVTLSLAVDIGRYWNIWRPVISGNPASVLFEVAMCVMIYLMVLYIEFIPITIERFRGKVSLPGNFSKHNLFVEKIMDIAGNLLGKVMFLFIIVGIVLSCLHQSGLGSLMLIAKYKIHPLWYTPMLPLLFLLSAIAVGFPMIVFESMIASKSLKREPEMDVLIPLARVIPVLIGLYLAVKLGDMIIRRSFIYLFDGTLQANAFIVEFVFGLVLPFIMLLFKRVRESAGLLFFASCLYVSGVVVNRMNVFIVSYTPPYMMGRYFPAIGEIAISVGIIAALIFFYRLLVTIFPVLSRETKYPKTAFIFIPAFLMILGNSIRAEAGEQNIIQDKRLIPDAVITIPSISDAPKVRIINNENINKNTDIYEPVSFMHSKHANIIQDCSICHHRVVREEGDTYGEPASMDMLVLTKTIPQKCLTCHDQPWDPKKINVPGLKGAYHRMCLGCHREMTQIPEADTVLYNRIAKGFRNRIFISEKAPTDCISCHGRKAPDHRELITFNENPDTGIATRKCLSCHEDQAIDILKSSHWRWEGASPFTIGNENRTDLGKRSELINNSTMALKGNWPECTVCHIGFRWMDDKFDFTDKTGIDCFVCHDTTGTYKKAVSGAGIPEVSVDIAKVARNVGKPGPETCGGNCHFSGGVNDPLRHGTINPRLLGASRDMDVHMGGDAKETTCRTCHRTRNHLISGRSISVPVVEGIFSCSTCHTKKPHLLSSLLSVHLNKHTDHVACQTCHIPLYSKGFDTITRRDWSGITDKSIRKENHEIEGETKFIQNFGHLTSKSNIKPEYRWYNGTVKRYLIGDPIENEITELNGPAGNIRDHNSKIYPFKVVTGKQISDAVYKIIIPPRLKGGFWDHGDWKRAAEQGMKLAAMPFSGEYEFVETVFFYGLNHEVLPKENALACVHCHSALNNENSCLKCHKIPENSDLGNLAFQGIDFEKYDKAGRITDYIDFKKLGYPGDPVETGGRFKRLTIINNADRERRDISSEKKSEPVKGKTGK